MKILRTRTLKCGAVKFYMEMEDEERELILFEGIKRYIKEKGLNLKVLPANNFPFEIDKMKTYDLSDNEEQYFLDVGFSSILCDNMKIPFPGLEVFDKFPKPRRSKNAIPV